MWKSAQPVEGEVLIKGEIPAEAVSTRSQVVLGKAVRVGGKVMLVVAIAMDTYAFYEAESKSREVARIAGGWTGAWAGGALGAWSGGYAGAATAGVCGQLGPQAAAPEEVVTVPLGAAIGSAIGGLAGSVSGYWAGSVAGKNYYDWVFGEMERLK